MIRRGKGVYQIMDAFNQIDYYLYHLKAPKTKYYKVTIQLSKNGEVKKYRLTA